MLNRYLLITVMIALVAFIWSCGGTPFHRDSTLNKNWGRSYETAKYNQIVNPEPAKKVDPITGLGGVPSDHNTKKYKDSFKKTEPKTTVNILKLQ
jgi:hypothetical protein